MTHDLPEVDPLLVQRAEDWHKEEQKQRRQEIENVIGRIEGDQRNGLLLTGAVWAWLATNLEKLANQGQFEQAVVFVPAVLMLFFFYRWRAMDRAMMTAAEYTRELEKRAGVDPLGWETWLAYKRANDRKATYLARTTRVFWCGLFVANLALGIMFGLPCS
ncbi:MAG: hypothetical protein ACRER2_05340 [Methylococcales bacterium]